MFINDFEAASTYLYNFSLMSDKTIDYMRQLEITRNEVISIANFIVQLEDRI